MEKVFLSIVIPNFNGGAFIKELMESINSIKNRDCVQVIFVDGASTDDSVSIATEYLLESDILISEPDEGQADAVQKGLLQCIGTYFIFQNSDDLFCSATLEFLLDEICKFSSVDVFAFSLGGLISVDDKFCERNLFQHFGEVSPWMLSKNIYFSNQSTVYKTIIARQVGFNKNFQFALDYDFVVRFFVNNARNVRYYSSILGYQRMHEGTKTSSLQNICKIETSLIRRTNFTRGQRLLGLIDYIIYHGKKIIFKNAFLSER